MKRIGYFSWFYHTPPAHVLNINRPFLEVEKRMKFPACACQIKIQVL
nr:MAG TPA: hypothetical protein [Caudoviricetes sp.]